MPSRNKKINRDFQIEGRRSVLEALKNPSRIEKLIISNSEKIGSQIEKILKTAKTLDISIDFVTKNQLDKASHTKKHQGVIAITTSPGYYTEKKLWDDLEENNQRVVVVLDGIQDPHNIGAISRTALAMGVFALVLPKRNSAGISPGSLRSSAGAIEHLKIVRVSNINSSLLKFKELGFWVIGLDHNSKNEINSVKMNFPYVIVVGSEGKGISELVLKNCDTTARIPIKGPVDSLNASVAAGIAFYELLKNYK